MRLSRVLIILSVLACQTNFAAPPPPPAGSPSCWPPPCIPIDGGISLLMAAGAAYGAKKLYDARKKSAKPE